MDQKKQIEGIAKILCGMANGCDGCMWDKVHCNERNYAEEIYNAGYRRRSENVIELPCKAGTMLYFLYNSPYADKPDLTPRIYKTADWYFKLDKTGIVICTSDIHGFNKKYNYYLGETVFLTKQGAEQAIAKMKGGAE